MPQNRREEALAARGSITRNRRATIQVDGEVIEGRTPSATFTTLLFSLRPASLSKRIGAAIGSVADRCSHLIVTIIYKKLIK